MTPDDALRERSRERTQQARNLSKEVFGNLCTSLAATDDEDSIEAIMAAAVLLGLNELIKELDEHGPVKVITEILPQVISEAASQWRIRQQNRH